jgi:hypothetical protein
MIELALALGWRLEEVANLDPFDLSTMVEVLNERGARGG